MLRQVTSHHSNAFMCVGSFMPSNVSKTHNLKESCSQSPKTTVIRSKSRKHPPCPVSAFAGSGCHMHCTALACTWGPFATEVTLHHVHTSRFESQVLEEQMPCVTWLLVCNHVGRSVPHASGEVQVSSWMQRTVLLMKIWTMLAHVLRNLLTFLNSHETRLQVNVTMGIAWLMTLCKCGVLQLSLSAGAGRLVFTSGATDR